MLLTGARMNSIVSCISDRHDLRLLLLAAIVCTCGIYGTSAIALHAARSDGQARCGWGITGIVAAGCTAWATHMLGMLAFNPGMDSGFDPLLTACSLFAAIVGISVGVGLAVGTRSRRRRFGAGVVLGLGVTALHYIGQAAYVVTGDISWDRLLVGLSVVGSLALFGVSMITFGERNRLLRRMGAPLLLAAIAVLHFCGMAAAKLAFNPRRLLPSGTLSPSIVAPIVAGVSLALLALAIVGLRFTLAARAAARRDRQRLRELASLALEGLAICDGDLIVTANQSLEELAGMSDNKLSGRTLGSLLPGVVFAELPECEERDAELAAADGQFLPVRVLRRSVLLGSKRQMVVAVRDQRERLKSEAKIRTLAFSDALTGLPNRARFNDLVAPHAASCRYQSTSFALMLVDLDRFKLVNDTLGHAAGDVVLCQVAERLRSVATGRSVVARLGGDEFAVLHVAPADISDCSLIAQRIVDVIGRPFVVEGQLVDIGASVGFAIAPENGTSSELLLRNADLALYQAKIDGRGTHCAFRQELGLRARDRQRMESDLRKALNSGEFEVHYQPLLEPRTRVIVSAEALVRWRHPDRGLISPAEFIPVAEETGLIGLLGRFVLRTACEEAASWSSEIRIAVNLSPAQFRDPHLVESILEVLAETGLPPQRLELEITEGVLLLDEQRTLATLIRLCSHGIGLAMDDFGTGYSSLSYLRRFPFSKVKVDRSFVRHLPADKESAAIIRAIVTLAATLGMSTTIEGVETAEQFNIVVAEKCDLVQGYYISRPLPAGDFRVFLGEFSAAA